MFAQKVAQKFKSFLGKFREIRAKIPKVCLLLHQWSAATKSLRTTAQRNG